jgi:hypothetical protein
MTRFTIALLVALSTATQLGCSHSSASSGPAHTDADLKTLTVDEVAARIDLNDGRTVVYDNNSKERYAQSHVLGARWLNFHEMAAADLPKDKTTTLVFYCANRL